MKKTFTLFSLVLFSQVVVAQETLLGNGINLNKIGFMVAPGYQQTKIAGENVGFFQIKGGVILDDRFTIGAFFGESSKDIRPAAFEGQLPSRANVDFSMGGGFVEYTLFSSKLIHFTFPLAVGVLEMEGDDYGSGVREGESTSVFFEPGAHLEFNIHKYARFFAGAGYRIMNNPSQERGFIPRPENALNLQVGIKLGMFRIKDSN